MKPALYWIRRFLGGILVLILVAFITFAIFNLWPSDPALAICGKPCTPERRALAEEVMGTGYPWYQQFWMYLAGIFTGRTFGSGAAAIHCSAPCLGYSFRMGEAVTPLIASRLPVTASLAIFAAILWVTIGIIAGVFAALYRGRPLDRVIMTGAVLGVSTPAYLFGLAGILLFGFTLGWLPVSDYVAFSKSPAQWFTHLIMPATVLALLYMAVYARLVRGNMIEQLGQDYIITARAKGASEKRVIWRHALPGVLLPVVTLFGLDLGGLLGGAVITESVFSLPGLGGLLMDAVSGTDLHLITGLVLLSATFVIVANLIVDALHTILDPRVAR
ncbi:peptide ABC transporter permease [Boudabousia liubingyangii]|uniref:Peptide ABC transporter permease n=1 Tax=Boudabousia liubingyangii TaxID=1921764 RepID=A0A1Q5PLL0_9ACTO|nr:ABC transporter permease [Boudabousia liubingyangii]OKL46962.1 peptide ABC transporter permease [Boudabousia liubingyangii]OKL47930.1 peptide ABC transporter permease [Boudabousia liubingyangii]